MPSPQGASQTAGVNADRATVAREACCAGPCRSPCAADRGQFRTSAAACRAAAPATAVRARPPPQPSRRRRAPERYRARSREPDFAFAQHGRSFADRADAGQHIFDLGRRDPDAGHPQHITGAAAVMIEAVRVPPTGHWPDRNPVVQRSPSPTWRAIIGLEAQRGRQPRRFRAIQVQPRFYCD